MFLKPIVVFQKRFMKVPTYRNNYSQLALINRMLISGNSINNFDFFHDNLTRLKSILFKC